MYSGKTEEMILRLQQARYSRRKVLCFKAAIDNRYDAENLATHEGGRFPSIPVGGSRGILDRAIEAGARVVGIDEAQFFDIELPDVCEALAAQGVRVIVAGLDTDSSGKPFSPMPAILALAEKVDKQAAFCAVCGEIAHRSQRITQDETLILVGSKGFYEARCWKHWSPEPQPPAILEG